MNSISNLANTDTINAKISLALESAVLQTKHICLNIDEYVNYSQKISFAQIIDQLTLVVDFLIVLKGYINQIQEIKKIQEFCDTLHDTLVSLVTTSQKHDSIMTRDILENELKFNLLKIEAFFIHYNGVIKHQDSPKRKI